MSGCCQRGSPVSSWYITLSANPAAQTQCDAVAANSSAPPRLTREQLVHHDARAPDVAPLVVALLNDLWGGKGDGMAEDINELSRQAAPRRRSPRNKHGGQRTHSARCPAPTSGAMYAGVPLRLLRGGSSGRCRMDSPKSVALTGESKS